MSLLWLLVETTAVQALGTAAVLTIPALAPAVAQTLGMPAGYVGYQVGLVYLAAMASSLIAGTLVARLGPCRTSQLAMVMAAAGCLLASVPHLAALAVGSLAIGGSYGMINPAASDLLARHVPPHRRNLLFSVKQTGVPIGGMLAGLIGPPLAVAAGWNVVLWSVAVAAILLALATQPSRRKLDAHAGNPPGPFRLSFEGLRTIRSSRPLLWLALASFCFSAVQLSLVAFLVVLLVEEVGLDLIGAGMILAAVQIAGAAGRILWGIVADFLRDGLVVLVVLALTMAASALVVTLLSPHWPLPAITAIFVVLGLSAVGWNGVYLSEIARLSPARAVGSTTGAAMFVTFTGVVIGPALFSASHGFLGSYTRSYVSLAALALIGGLLAGTVLVRERRARRRAKP